MQLKFPNGTGFRMGPRSTFEVVKRDGLYETRAFSAKGYIGRSISLHKDEIDAKKQIKEIETALYRGDKIFYV